MVYPQTRPLLLPILRDAFLPESRERAISRREIANRSHPCDAPRCAQTLEAEVNLGARGVVLVLRRSLTGIRPPCRTSRRISTRSTRRSQP